MLAYYLHNLDPFIFRLWGDVGPRWYGLAYVLAFVFGYCSCCRLSKRGYLDLSPVGRRRLCNLDSALRSDGGRPSWLCLFLSARHAPRTAFHLARLGRRNVQSWRNSRDCDLHSLSMRAGTSSPGPTWATIWSSPRRSACSLAAAPISSMASFMAESPAFPWAVQFPKELLEPGDCRGSRSRPRGLPANRSLAWPRNDR